MSEPGLFEKNLLDRPVVGYLFIAALIVAWEACARLIPGFAAYLPSFARIVSTGWRMTASGELPIHAGHTVSRLFIGYFYAIAVAVPLGLAVGRSRIVLQLLEPTLEFLRPTPAIAIIPIAMLVFGLSDQMKTIVIAWGAFWPVFLNVIDGVRSVDTVLQDTARAYGYRGGKLLWRVIVPGTLPYAMAGLRLGLTIALVLGIFIEVFTGGNGLGFLLQHYNEAIRLPEMYAAVLVIAVLGFALYVAFVAIEARVIGWHFNARQGA